MLAHVLNVDKLFLLEKILLLWYIFDTAENLDSSMATLKEHCAVSVAQVRQWQYHCFEGPMDIPHAPCVRVLAFHISWPMGWEGN